MLYIILGHIPMSILESAVCFHKGYVYGRTVMNPQCTFATPL